MGKAMSIGNGRKAPDSAAEARFEVWIVSVGFLVIVGAFFVTAGAFTIDEVIYLLGARAVAETGTFVVENGWDRYRSNDLLLWFMREGASGPVPQYPPGTAIFGAPLYALAGLRGLILLNAAAAGFTLWITYRLARRVTGDEFTAVGSAFMLFACTFFIEYAYGVWPHAVATASVATAVLLTLDAAELSGRPAFSRALVAGVAVGMGLLFRIDVGLVLPAIGIFILLAARAPLLVSLGGALGVLGPVAVMSWANVQKFGTFNPLSYGLSGGGSVSIAGYWPIGIAVAAGALGILAFRVIEWRPSRRMFGGMVGVVALALLALPQGRQAILGLIDNAYPLFFDMTKVTDSRLGVEPEGSATRLFWGFPKKSLGQSLPWLGVLAIVLICRDRAKWRWHAFAGLILVIWSAPFVLKEWHGGLSLNMRYLLPLLPIIAVLGAEGIKSLTQGTEISKRALLLSFVVGLFAVFALSEASATSLIAAHQPLALMMFTLTLIACAIAALRTEPTHLARKGASVLVMASLGFALAIGPLGDHRLGQASRTAKLNIATAVQDLPGPLLIYGRPETLTGLIERPDAFLAIIDFREQKPDPELIAQALEDGRRVYAETGMPGLSALVAAGRFQIRQTLPAHNTTFDEVVLP